MEAEGVHLKMREQGSHLFEMGPNAIKYVAETPLR